MPKHHHRQKVSHTEENRNMLRMALNAVLQGLAREIFAFIFRHWPGGPSI
jgi:hypothetical protein